MQGKPRVILDGSVVVSGIGWRGGDSRKVLTLLALDGFQSYRSPWLTAEWVETVQLDQLAGLVETRLEIGSGHSCAENRETRSNG